ncbi:MAG: 50S ribosomal protein L17 [Bacteroidales bacterium]|nr:50S ribosomal protein L17 [Bacteroidales bacterium]
MRHNNKINALGRKSAHRKAMLSNMATSLILHKRIMTTVARAKALRVYIEPIITKSKEDTTHSRRLAFSYLQDKNAVTELFREVSPKVMERPGGYTRILKTGNRLGDSAEMCYIELVDFNESMLAAKAATEAKATRRSRRGSKKKTGTETEMKGRQAVVAARTETESKKMKAGVPEKKPEDGIATEKKDEIKTRPEQDFEVKSGGTQPSEPLDETGTEKVTSFPGEEDQAGEGEQDSGSEQSAGEEEKTDRE